MKEFQKKKNQKIGEKYLNGWSQVDISASAFRFHDLRRYSASIMHAIGDPDQYIMERGGWKSDKVLKQVYRGTLNEYQKNIPK